MSKDKIKVTKDKRTVNMQVFSAASIIIAIVIAVVGNILFEGIFGNKLNFDLTSTSQNSITQESLDMINSLPSDTRIRIVGLMERPENIKNSVFEYIVPLLDDYAAKSGGRITVEYIDPNTYPSIWNELDPTNSYDLEEYYYVVKCGDRLRVINPEECYTYDQQYGYALNNMAESNFSGAIMQITNDSYKKAYFITDLSNADEHVMLSSVLDSMSIRAYDLPASDDFTIPSDCDILFISGINTDIPERVEVALIDYFNRGGKVIVAINYYYNAGESFEHLNNALSYMNIKISEDNIIENDPDHMLSNSGYQSYLDISSDFAQISGINTRLTGSYLRPVMNAANPDSTVSSCDILLTSGNACIPVYDEETGDILATGEGQQYSVGRYSTMESGAELFVFGTTDFTSDNFIATRGSNHSNVSFLRGIIRSTLNVDDYGFVPSKPLSDYSIDNNKVNTTTVNILSLCLMLLVPLTLVICGVVIYKKRKNL